MIRVLSCVLVLGLLCGSAWADVVHLKDGRALEGKTRWSKDGATLVIEGEYGDISVPKAQVVKIEKAEAPPPPPADALYWVPAKQGVWLRVPEGWTARINSEERPYLVSPGGVQVWAFRSEAKRTRAVFLRDKRKDLLKRGAKILRSQPRVLAGQRGLSFEYVLNDRYRCDLILFSGGEMKGLIVVGQPKAPPKIDPIVAAMGWDSPPGDKRPRAVRDAPPKPKPTPKPTPKPKPAPKPTPKARPGSGLGLWAPPGCRLRIPQPPGWVAKKQDGLSVLFPPDPGESECLIVLRIPTPRKGLTAKKNQPAQRRAILEKGGKIEREEIRILAGHQILDCSYQSGGHRWRDLTFFLGDFIESIVIRVSPKRAADVERILAGVKVAAGVKVDAGSSWVPPKSGLRIPIPPGWQRLPTKLGGDYLKGHEAALFVTFEPRSQTPAVFRRSFSAYLRRGGTRVLSDAAIRVAGYEAVEIVTEANAGRRSREVFLFAPGRMIRLAFSFYPASPGEKGVEAVLAKVSRVGAAKAGAPAKPKRAADGWVRQELPEGWSIELPAPPRGTAAGAGVDAYEVEQPFAAYRVRTHTQRKAVSEAGLEKEMERIKKVAARAGVRIRPGQPKRLKRQGVRWLRYDARARRKNQPRTERWTIWLGSLGRRVFEVAVMPRPKHEARAQAERVFQSLRR